MSVKHDTFDRVFAGIADYDKETLLPGSVAWLRSIDYRSDPRKLTLLPKTVKESGNVYLGMPKWFTPRGTTGYIYDELGNLYQRSSAGSHTLLRSVANSHGNGLAYYGEDDFVYYTTDIAIGRYGQFNVGSATFADDFLGAQGGIPTNTASLDLEAASSEYATKTDNAGLSITGDISMEAYIKPETLPAVGNAMTLLSKWNENGNQRSYRFDIYAISGYFGDGSDGAVTISSNSTEAPIDSACSGTLAASSLTATNVSFAIGQIIFIHQSRGTGAGTWQRNKIAGYTAGTITLESPLNYSYGSGAQVRVFKQYTNFTVNAGITYTEKAWDGTVGGILGFLANGTVTISGTITGTGKGFRGGAAVGRNSTGYQGEGTAGAGTQSNAANGNGGGGGIGTSDAGCGGAGGNANSGGSGSSQGAHAGGTGGAASGTNDLTTMTFGGGGGSGGGDEDGTNSGAGGNGGGIIFITGNAITVTGSIVSHGNPGADGNNPSGTEGMGGGGGGGAGSILLKAQTATLGSSLILANGGVGGISPRRSQFIGGTGSEGRIHLDYYTSYTGTSSPTLNATQDNTLVTTTSYQLRFSVSSNGTNSELLTKNSTIVTGEWVHVAMSWDASAATVTFAQNGVSLGSSVGTFTSIYNSTADFAVGAYFDGAGAAAGLYDGLIDDSRLWNVTHTVDEFYANKDTELAGNEAGLVAYHQFDSNMSDTTSAANDLTHSGTPVYSTDVPFSAPTTRLDKDQEDTSTGSTSITAAAISEGASGRQTFVPTKDPQKSIKIFISDTGDNCDWTVTVHDALNREIAAKTLTHAQVSVGAVEFVFATPWTPILDASYHFHITTSNTTGAPAVVSGSLNNLETAEFTSYYQFLVTDTAWHPVLHYSNIIAIGNGRYLATWDAASYNPHRLKFPSGYTLRCLGRFNEYLAMGFQKGSTISENDEGLLALWDGFSDTYNLAISIPQGAINAMLGSAGQLDFIAGSHMDLMRYLGGAEASKIRRLPKITQGTTAEIFPGAMTMWQALERIGIAGDSDSSVVERGVYTFGSLNEQYPESLSYDYPISTGSRLSTVDVGMVAVAGDQLLIGWRDGTAAGVDVVDPAGVPFATGTIEYLIKDEGGVWKEKILSKVRADYQTLNAGESIAIKHKLDRADLWTTDSTGVSTDDDATRTRADIDGGRHKEYQIAIDFATTTTTAPKLLGALAEVNILEEEEFV